MKYPPTVQAILDACEAVPLHCDPEDGEVRLGHSADAMQALARAINHYRAAMAEGFVPDASPVTAAEERIAQLVRERDEANRLYSISYQEKIEAFRAVDRERERAEHFEQECIRLSGQVKP